MNIYLKFTMINTDEFILRLEKIMEMNQLNAATFSEIIGVQRSSVSHILSKRNKPSLDFILKINKAFEDVKLDWLILGEINGKTSTNLAEKTNLELENNSFHKNNTDSTSKKHIQIKNEEVIQIIHMYCDGSFQSFFPKS